MASGARNKPIDSQQSRPRPPRPAQRRVELRELLWPGQGHRVWDRRTKTGFCTIPRLLPLILVLIKDLAKRRNGVGDPSSVYLELWSRSFDEGLVQIRDDAECAYASGYAGTRASRSWRERIDLLQQIGFIETKRAHNREYAHVLLIDPIVVCAELHKKGDVADEWWNAFVGRAQEIGASIPAVENLD